MKVLTMIGVNPAELEALLHGGGLAVIGKRDFPPAGRPVRDGVRFPTRVTARDREGRTYVRFQEVITGGDAGEPSWYEEKEVK